MGDKDKDAKKNSVETRTMSAAIEAMKSKLAANWPVILGVLVVVILLLNVHWTMMENKISATVAKETGTFKADLAKLNGRITETEQQTQQTIDLDALKKDVESIKKAGENFEKRLAAVIKAEEEKLARLDKDVENQKAYIDELKSLLEETAE